MRGNLRFMGVAFWALALCATTAFAGTITVDLSGVDSGDFAGTGIAHFAGTDSLERAFNAMFGDTTYGPNTTVTILESGTYVGDIYVTQPGTVLTVAAGVTPRLVASLAHGVDPVDTNANQWAGTITAGASFVGWPDDGWHVPSATLTLRGDSPSNQMIVEAAPVAGGKCIVSAAPGGILAENVEFV
ncbi:MAG: hypothetical protein CVV50_05185, partial [Spirochaetae bacterium HGW-Spirochaetae-6]